MFGRKRGQEADGVELALSYLDSLYAAARRLTHDGSSAEDLVQEAFLRGYRYYRRLTDAEECKALLYRIMVNLWLKDRRRAQREVSLGEPAGELSPKAERGGGGWVNRGPDPEAEMMKKTFLIAVDQALRKLPPELQATVILADVEGFTYQEMAKILQWPLGTVMSRLHRARRCLEREMQAFAEDADKGRTQI
jgi:RNA polymerase sigma-70 factor (ECF subfamily)